MDPSRSPIRRRSLVARAAGAAALALALLGAPEAASAQGLGCDAGDVEVRRLHFEGNTTFTDQELADSLVTTPSDWYRRVTRVFGDRRCLDPDEIQRDALRLVVFYRMKGFWSVQVSSEIRSTGSRTADAVFTISEGEPIILDSLVVRGMDPADSARVMRGLAFPLGDRYDRYLVAANIRQIVARLRNEGYPRADALTNADIDTVDRVARLDVDVQPGPRAYIGSVRVQVEPAAGKQQEISAATVRRIIGIRPGALYRERDLVVAQRVLYQLDAYRHVEVRIAPDDQQLEADSLITIDIGLIEGDMHAALVGVGYATLDCVRTQGQYTERNFLGGARRMELTGRLSKIGVEEEWLPCGIVRNDPFSQQLNYSVSASFSQPALFGIGPRSLPTIGVYSERRSEYRAFVRATSIGLIASQRVEARPRLPVVLSYQVELGQTDAQPALFCAVFGVCDVIDQEQLKARKWLAVASASLVRDRTDDPFAPASGSILRLDFRHASTAIGSSPDVQFNKLVTDASRYWRIGEGQVLAARIRLGGVLGASYAEVDQFIPPQERLYAGGPSTVRGFRQNELGPILYRVDSYDTIPGPGNAVYYRASPDTDRPEAIPKGGNTLIVGNVEYRMRSPVLPNLLQWTAFADVGAVWNREDEHLSWSELRWTPGIGLRVMTLIGPVRVDVGYNPYARRAGAAFYDAPLDEEGSAPLFCVSPGNTIPIIDGRPPADAPSCNATFQPATRRGFAQRLNFSFSIGQAF
ncbi:MAG TPA: BamA/TamA family outer membrane protein [Gemmatimonadaceae bacterium]|nr:BamA/TamA family outer membrane protein [Gemmatimonadaceae bacterium]